MTSRPAISLLALVFCAVACGSVQGLVGKKTNSQVRAVSLSDSIDATGATNDSASQKGSQCPVTKDSKTGTDDDSKTDDTKDKSGKDVDSKASTTTDKSGKDTASKVGDTKDKSGKDDDALEDKDDDKQEQKGCDDDKDDKDD